MSIITQNPNLANLTHSNASMNALDPMSMGGMHNPPVEEGMIVAQQQRPSGSQQEVVKLSIIIERAVQSAYHELIVLAELLPRKPDVERKVELCKWCVKTRQMFVRVFALAKWVSQGASKLDKSSQMSEFLDTQASFFLMAADTLHIMANEDLANAKLPTFYIPPSVDVLSTGSYPRLPCAIREKVVEPERASQMEKVATLMKLNRIIPCVLADSDFPREFSDYSVSNGRVTFTVANEFKVTLTLFGVETSLPWRLLDIQFLIEDEGVSEGRALVHELQKNYLIAMIQNKLNSKEFQLVDVYSYLHQFCQTLRLEVVHAQVLCLSLEQRNPFIGVSGYKIGSELKIFYWKDLRRVLGKPTVTTTLSAATLAEKDSQSSILYSIVIKLEESTGSFAVTHLPKLEQEDEEGGSMTSSCEMHMKLFWEPERLKISELIAKTTFIRSQCALKSALEFLNKHSPTFPTVYNPSEPSISLQILHPQPVDQSESLKLTVQSKTGMFVVTCPKLSVQTCSELESAINKELPTYKLRLESIRKWFLLERVNNSLYGLTCSVVESPSFEYSSSHPYSSLPETKIFLQIESNGRYFVIVCIESRNGFVQPTYYLLQLFQPKTGHATLLTPSGTGGKSDQSRFSAYKPIQIASLLPLKPQKCSSEERDFDENSDITKCRNDSKKFKVTSDFDDEYSKNVQSVKNNATEEPLTLPGLRNVVSSCYVRFLTNSVQEAIRSFIPGAQFFSTLSEGAPCIIITKMPDYNLGSVSKSSQASFKKSIKTVELRPRVHRNFRSVLGITFVTTTPTCNQLVKGGSAGAGGGNRCGSNRSAHLESVFEINRWSPNSFFSVPVSKLVNQWKHMLKLYDEYSIVKHYIDSFSHTLNADKPWLEIVSFNFDKLTLAYGPRQRFTVTFNASYFDKGCHPIQYPEMPKLKITFGTKYNASASEIPNPHLGSYELLANAEYGRPETQILDLMYSLHVTSRPMCLIYGLDRQVKVGVSFCNRPTDFCHSQVNLVAHGITKLTIFYRFIFAIDVEFFKDCVALSDGALSRFSEDVTKTPTLKSHYAPQKLEKFHWLISKVLTRRTSHASSSATPFGTSLVSTMSPDSFPTITLQTPPPNAFGQPDFTAGFNDMASTPGSLPSVVPSDDSDSLTLVPSAMTPSLTVPTIGPKGQFETPELDCKFEDAMDSSLYDFESSSSLLQNADDMLPNSCVRVSYQNFAKLVQKRVQCQDLSKTRISVVELYLAWTFLKWDLMGQITESFSHEEHTLKLAGPNGLVTVLGMREDFLGLYMKITPQTDLNISNQSDDITVLDDKQLPPSMSSNPTSSLSSSSAEQQNSLSEKDQKFLQTYFQHQIAVLPFRSPLLLAWCNFLLLPAAVVSDFASILRFETNPSPEFLWFIKVTWTFPMQQISNVAINKIGSTCIRRGSPSSSDSVMFLFTFTSKKSVRQLELPLTYNWSSRKVVPAIQNSVFDQYITEAIQSITSQSQTAVNLERSFLSTCIEYILTKMSE